MAEKDKVSSVEDAPPASTTGGGVTGTGGTVGQASANSARVYVNGIPHTGAIWLRQVGDSGWSIEKVELKSVLESGG